MLPASPFHCDCCGLPVNTDLGEDCPRCGYPVDGAKEERFLMRSIDELERVVRHGGANLTVRGLIQRYWARVHALRASSVTPVMVTTGVAEVVSTGARPLASHPTKPLAASLAPLSVSAPRAVQSVNMVPSSYQQPRARAFSLRAFLADQTINIIASLGAFLILLGALSFVAVTHDVWRSFLVVFMVQALFGATGVLTYRFQTFRVVALIYTAIFALLVPLVGFSGYRLVVHHLVPLSAPTLIAAAAAYAAIVYSLLTIYQRFRPFGYLAACALLVADLATAQACKLDPSWWSVALLLPAIPLLISVQRRYNTPWPFFGNASLLRNPLRVLMFICVVTGGCGLVLTFCYSLLVADYTGHPAQTLRLSIACATSLLFVWACLYVWLARARWPHLIPYLFLSCVLAFAYALHMQQIGYALVLTTVAWLYHGVSRVAGRSPSSFGRLRINLDIVALILVSLVPLIGAPLVPWWLLVKAFSGPSAILHGFSEEVYIAVCIILVGSAVPVSVALNRAGMNASPAASRVPWCLLLVLGGLLLMWAYGIITLVCGFSPAWSFLGLTLAFVIGGLLFRRTFSSAWSNPLDILAVLSAASMLLFVLGQPLSIIIAFWLGCAALAYAILLYQHRLRLLFLPLVYALPGALALLFAPHALLVVTILLPFLAMIVRRWRISLNRGESIGRGQVVWERPLLVTGIIYALLFALHDSSPMHNTIHDWLGIPFSLSLELALLAVAWYVAATLARATWWQGVVMVLAAAALLQPGNAFWVLAWLAPACALLALAVGRLSGRMRALPFYLVAVLAAVMMGSTAAPQGQMPLAVWTLLSFAVLIYLAGMVEDALPLLWIGPFFALWSLISMAQLGNLYGPPAAALVCAGCGIALGCLKHIRGESPLRRLARLRYALPCYAVALGAATLTGVYGSAAGVNHPFYAAVPSALLLFALVTFVVLCFERRPAWLWLVAGLALWGTSLAVRTARCVGQGNSMNIGTLACSAQVQLTACYLTALAFGMGVLALFISHVSSRALVERTGARLILPATLRWSWPWHLSSCIAVILTVCWQASVNRQLLPGAIEYGSLVVFILLTTVIMLLERIPELLIFPAGLIAWMIARSPLSPWQQLLAYSLLFITLFASRVVWRRISPSTRLIRPARLHTVLGLGGQLLVVLAAIVQGGLSTSMAPLTHVGALALLVMAVLLFWCGREQYARTIGHSCVYVAGLLAACAISWELFALGWGSAEVYSLPPATYLIVIAPLLSLDAMLPQRYRAERLCSIIGSLLLLLPTLWLSFSHGSLRATALLAAEALALLLLGFATRIRPWSHHSLLQLDNVSASFMVYSGAALIVVSAIHAMFLTAPGLSTPLALSLSGFILLAMATLLAVARKRFLVGR